MNKEVEFKKEIKTWYCETFPTDDLGLELNEGVTFEDLFDALDNYKDVYEVFGVGDSLIRERLFQRLADIIGMDYTYVYDQWLKGV